MTDPSSPDDAPFLDRLPGEIEQWRKEGLVRPEQAEALLARYGLLPGETPRSVHQSRIIQVLSVLGVVLVGVGAILLIGANWEAIPKWVRLAMLVLSTAAAYCFGYWMAFQRETYPKLGMALLLLGSLLWGAGIFLIGQMYHLGGPNGGGETTATLIWFLGVIPLAYVLRSPWHLALSIVIGSMWLCMTMTAQESHHSPTLPQFMAVSLVAGALLYALSRLHAGSRRLEGMDVPLRWFGLVYVFMALYAFSFRDSWGRYSMDSYQDWLLPGVILGAAAVAAAALLLTRGLRDRATLTESVALFCLLLLAVGVAVYEHNWSPPAGAAGAYSHSEAGLFQIALLNLLLLAAAIGVVGLGWARNHPNLANFGIFVFFVQVVTRYFDLLGGMLSSGFMFIGAGLLLVLLGAGLERSRRTLLSAMAARRA